MITAKTIALVCVGYGIVATALALWVTSAGVLTHRMQQQAILLRGSAMVMNVIGFVAVLTWAMSF